MKVTAQTIYDGKCYKSTADIPLNVSYMSKSFLEAVGLAVTTAVASAVEEGIPEDLQIVVVTFHD
jgi:hypothetical protein